LVVVHNLLGSGLAGLSGSSLYLWLRSFSLSSVFLSDLVLSFFLKDFISAWGEWNSRLIFSYFDGLGFGKFPI
jgi:hypothetical protein